MFRWGGSHYALVATLVASRGFGLGAKKNASSSLLMEMQSGFLLAADYSPGAIAPDGQTSAQVPQSTHTSGSIEYLSPSEIAPDGHSSIHVPQATQSSLIT